MCDLRLFFLRRNENKSCLLLVKYRWLFLFQEMPIKVSQRNTERSEKIFQGKSLLYRLLLTGPSFSNIRLEGPIWKTLVLKIVGPSRNGFFLLLMVAEIDSSEAKYMELSDLVKHS